MRFLFVVISSFWPFAAGPLFAAADLTWGRTIVELRASTPVAELEFSYPFRNNSDQPVAVAYVEPDCPCIATEISADRFEPGESGHVTARYSAGARHGRHTHQIVVTYADPTRKPTVLALIATLPPAYRVEPTAITWAANAPPDAAHEIVITPAAGRPLESVRAASSTPELTLSPAPGPAGEWRVSIRRSPRFDGRLASVFVTMEGPQTERGTVEIFVSGK